METIELKKNVLWREIDNEVILLETDKGNFFRLNKTGAVFLKLISEGKNIETAIEQIATDFKTPKESVEIDVRAFVDSMKTFGVLKTND